jgi:transposase-like protein
MSTIDDARRAAIARGWLGSSRNQREFAAEYGISERTLRAWVSKYAVRQPTGEVVRAVVKEAIEKFTAILQALDADAASRTADAGPSCARVLRGPTEPAVAAATTTTRAPAAHPAAPPAAEEHPAHPPRRAGGFFQDFDPNR